MTVLFGSAWVLLNFVQQTIISGLVLPSITKEDKLGWNVVQNVHFDETHIALTAGRMRGE